MTVVWTADAAADLDQVLAYIAARSPSGAAKVAARIEATIVSISEFPFAGRKDDETGCRERLVGPHPLLIVYTVDDALGSVEIIAVFHTSRDPMTKRGG